MPVPPDHVIGLEEYYIRRSSHAPLLMRSSELTLEEIFHNLYELERNALAVWDISPYSKCVFLYIELPLPRCRGPPDQSEFLAIQTDRR